MIHQPKTKPSRPAASTSSAASLPTGYTATRPPAGTVVRPSASVAGRQMTFDPNAVQAAVGSLYETLRRCEDERVKLVNLMDDAKQASSQQQKQITARQQSESTASEVPAVHESLTAQQLNQIPAMDGWISRRLAELHAADRALSQRQTKLEALENSLTRISQGLGTQLQEINKAKNELAGEHGSIEARMLAATNQLNQQAKDAERQVQAHADRMSQAQEQVDAGLLRIETTGQASITSMQQQFETMAQGIVSRLEGVRKPVEKWLKQHLDQYETQLNERVEQAHIPIAQRIETIQEEVAQAIAPIEENLKQHIQTLLEQVQNASSQIHISMDEQAQAIHESMAERVQKLDEEVARLIEPVLVKAASQEQAVLDKAAGVEEAFEEKAGGQRLAFEKTIQEQAYAAQSQIRVAVQSANSQMAVHVKTLHEKLDQHTTQWAADAQQQIDESLKRLDQNLSRGLEELGHKANEVDRWYASRRGEMNDQMNQMEAQSKAAADGSEQIMVHRVNQIKKQLPQTVELLVQKAQQEVQNKVAEFHTQIQNAYQQALTESQDRSKYLESQTLAQFGESDQRMRQRMATLHGDARSMLEMIENQLTRRVEACQAKVANVKHKSIQSVGDETEASGYQDHTD